MTTPKHPSGLPLGIAAAAVGAVVGAFLWALLVTVTDYKIGYAAVGVGALAGFLGGRFGGGAPQLPVIAAVIGVLGCLLGDVFSDAHELSQALKEFRGESVSSLEVVKEVLKDPAGFGWDLYKEGFRALDALFYGLAALAGFRLATAQGELHKAPAPGYGAPEDGSELAPPTGPPSAHQPPAAP